MQNENRTPRCLPAPNTTLNSLWRRNANGVAILVLFLLLIFVGASSATARTAERGPPPRLTPADIEEGVREGSSPEYSVRLADSQAAEELPHRELGREQAIDLMESVFGPVLKAPAGIFDELEVERFLSDTAAILPAREQLEPAETVVGSSPSERYEGPTLIESTVPLRTEGGTGPAAVVDLGLEHAEGQLRPANPLVEVAIPHNLGEGIELPEAGVTINPDAAPADRSPSLVDESVAAYPEVATDTSLSVSPTLRGVETLTVLQSPQAPHTQTFELELPNGADLKQTEAGGAEVTQAGRSLLGVAPPSALDAAEHAVPVTLEVAGNDLVLKVSPSPSTAWPVIVDPLYETYNWWNGITGLGGWSGWTNTASNYYRDDHDHCDPFASPYSCQQGETSNAPGLFIGALPGAVPEGSTVNWEFVVPRWFEEWEQHEKAPSSWISSMYLGNVGFWQRSDWAADPTLWMGLWNTGSGGWVSGRSASGNYPGMNGDFGYDFIAGQNTFSKLASFSLVNPSGYDLTAFRDAFVNTAIITIADDDKPNLAPAIGPNRWVNDSPTEPINVTASDQGLGVYRLRVSLLGSQQTFPNHTMPCTGTTIYPCTGTVAFNVNDYNPSVMPQGVDNILLTAEDPLGNQSETTAVKVWVDHTAPNIALSGTLTQQAALGTKLNAYGLHVDATDGNAGDRQSGVGKMAIKVDGSVAYEDNPGCADENCAMSHDWSLNADEYTPGQHTVEVSATDEVGLTTTKTLAIELAPDHMPPKLELSGTATEQATLGVSRPRYKLKLKASDRFGAGGPATFVSAFGSEGSGDGQLNLPVGISADAQGNIWVADTYNNRIQEFSREGKYLTSFGEEGSGPGQLRDPYGLAIDPDGNVWVADTENDRIQKFSATGEYLGQFGEEGTGPGQFERPGRIAINPEGTRLWVTDIDNNRIQELSYNPKTREATFIKAIGEEGTGDGQFATPYGVAIGPEGNIWVADTGNHRIQEFSSAGEYLSQFAEQGSSDGQVQAPTAIAFDEEGNAWVADLGNSRIEEFSPEGDYMTQFGQAGSGDGELSGNFALAIDPEGNLWVADTWNDRIQEWQIPTAFTCAKLFSSAGSGEGQLNLPVGLATGPQGNIWVADTLNSRIQEFSPEGQYLTSFGEEGSGPGQLQYPYGLAIDSQGHVWVADTGNHRIEEFNANGQYLSQFGESGSGDGEFEFPVRIAFNAKGNALWVADTGNDRLEQFSTDGEFLGAFGESGSGDGQFSAPAGIDLDSEGNLWVVDSGNDRIEEFNYAGEYVGRFGEHGSDDGQLDHPTEVALDEAGDFWVADAGNSRVEEFSQEGEYMTQFGQAGSGDGELNNDFALAIDPEGNLWVADSENSRIQEWNQLETNAQSGIASTEISVDGEPVSSNQEGCTGENCRISADWTLDSPGYSEGEHTIEAKATDGRGNTTTKDLTIEVQPDTEKPTLEASGELVDAPEGWVEQESYDLAATAADGGYGVTSLSFKVDGETVASDAQSCLDGDCEASISKSLDMASYSGGAHEARLIATDGAGNTASKAWTINVDPEGHISSAEAIDTLEASDATAESTVISPTDEIIGQEEQEAGNDPALEPTGDGYTATGIPTKTQIPADSAEPITIPTPAGESIQVEQLQVAEDESVDLANDAVTVQPNADENVDVVVRPVYDGFLAFANIRDRLAPETYSWRVILGKGQVLVQTDEKTAEVRYPEDGTIAASIRAELAHDATGKELDTFLSVEAPDVVTLTVRHRVANVTYPVVAGPGFEVGYESVTVYPPVEEVEEEETEGDEANPEATPLYWLRPESADSVTSAVNTNGALRSSEIEQNSLFRRRYFRKELCSKAGCDKWNTNIDGHFRQLGSFYVERLSGVGCEIQLGTSPYWPHPRYVPYAEVKGTGWNGPQLANRGTTHHLTAWCHFILYGYPKVNRFGVNISEEPIALLAYVWGDGFVQRKWKHWDRGYQT